MKRRVVPQCEYIGPFFFKGWLYQLHVRHVMMKNPAGLLIPGRYKL